MIFFIIILFALYIGWNIGANDAANCVGADVGSGKMSLKEGIIITSVFSFLGALLLGSHVTKTIGKGIVPLNRLEPHLGVLLALAAILGAALFVTFATYKKLPVSTSHAIVGAVAGAGVAVRAPVVWSKLGDIFICWILTPFSAALFSYFLYFLAKRLFPRLIPSAWQDQFLRVMILLTSAYMAFTWGANDVANASGVLVGIGRISLLPATIICAVAIIIGIVTWGYKVIETVGSGITRLTPLMVVVVEIAAAVNINLFTVFGIPVSTSHSIIGAVVGVGLIEGIKTLNKRIIRDIFLAWLATPLVSGLLAFFILKIVLLLK
ncbi:MAG: inorganic phosphate transporter [bacterium (Candidatus Ratteibacteria) CG_4_9_14_3_um_filter_41_21]|uniref:Inorganic phosphate transporter n=2 Tax=Candidatus Ratteibacteria TaxID=2979319 RepID=A0A2M7YFH7_9BACT|nr:MAG: hypothetical protein AUJ76_02440 [Candidatus Omnitrophica bacterium CG1_02_41_171]PIW33128.1 MAG: inorganic phosphate transporter [bacterium (Candidatus Ratteibacteria) CG15_BIG_FIL_POST_REV_8_21_14_020_41_12]PJA61731.1 MAG: inorganic phosphate transporter [bacterium (Candidatus Ratteibacteria) CG_4_9_14_3_um_filter_41_21]HCG76782.1 inorganic phosphate transporter [bacterium]